MSKIRISEQVRAIMDHYGYENQREQFAEECAEAILAVQKCKRRKSVTGSQEAFENLQEEVADVIIMATQMYCFLGAYVMDRIITNKIMRQIERIRKEEE